MALSEYDLKRYNRQILIPGLGHAGQERLKESRIFIAGAGGLGSPVATYLAVAGAGHLTIVDMDQVDLSNLNRQILHWDMNLGEKKVDSAAAKLRELNPVITVTALHLKIDETNVFTLTAGMDLIIDAMDNFETRYLLNHAAITHDIPFIHASVRGLEGRITTIIPGKTPCFRCIFPESMHQEVFPVLGSTPGVIGSMQACEAVKYLTGIGELLTGRMVVYDGEYMEFHEIPVAKDAACPACSHL